MTMGKRSRTKNGSTATVVVAIAVGLLLLLLSPLILIDHRYRYDGSALFADAFVIQKQQSIITKGSITPPSFVTIIPTPSRRSRRKTSTTASSSKSSTTALQLRVAFQGESGAYSEKSTKELLGPAVMALGYTNFEDCFRAVKRMEVDYACLPIENSLGGSIHENYDLMLRYDLTICAEHEFRVQHCVLYGGTGLQQGNEAPTSTAASSSSSAAPSPSTVTNLLHGTIRYAISHPQALAQCDNYLRSFNIIPIPTYDTAGSAKMIQEQNLPPGCTPDNTIAIASDLAGETYGMECLAKGVEDDDSNFTRFLLLGRKGVLEYLQPGTETIPSKTSVVFTLPNTAGALYKALACFSLREIDFSKIESRPTSAALLNYLKFKKAANTMTGGPSSQQQQQQQHDTTNTQDSDESPGSETSSVTFSVDTTNNDEPLPDDLPRFRYCFYLDFLDAQLSQKSENALANLREFTDFVRILGSYPRKSRLVGPVAQAAQDIQRQRMNDASAAAMRVATTAVATTATEDTATTTASVDTTNTRHEGSSTGNTNASLSIGFIGFGSYGQVFATEMIQQKHRVSCFDKDDKSAEADQLGVDFYYDIRDFLQDLDVVVLSVPLIALEETVEALPVEALSGKLIVDIAPLNDHPKAVLFDAFANDPTIDVLLTNPLLGILPKEEVVNDTTKKKMLQSRYKGGRNGGNGGTSNNNGVVTIMAPDRGNGHSAGVSSKNTWEGRQMIYERARVADIPRCDKYLKIFENARCEIIEGNSGGSGISTTSSTDIGSTTSSSGIDETIGDAEFVTHMIGRLLDDRELLTPTPIMSNEYKELTKISQLASSGSFNRFYAMYKYSKDDRAKQRIKRLRENLAALECDLAAREAYLSAKSEMMQGDRQKLLAETRSLLQELAKNSVPSAATTTNSNAKDDASEDDSLSFVDDEDVETEK